MTRRLLIVMAALVTGCAHPPYKAPTQEKPSATLVFQRGSETFAPNRQGGIFAVDGHLVVPSQRFSVALAPGRHHIAYLCPGWMYVDGFPMAAHEFRSEKQYELRCLDGDVYISP
jgi:hypothetical protein